MSKLTNSLSTALSNFAVKNWKKQMFRDEWLAVILLVLVLKLGTSAVSIFSGWYYLQNFYTDFVSSELAARCFSVLSLILIEFLNALFLAKFFKFALRVDFKTAVMPLICAALTFSVSFIISTNGIAVYVNESETQTESVKTDFAEQKNSVSRETEKNIADVESYIETIKANPENWSNGKRCILSTEQNREIAVAFNRIEEYKESAAARIAEIEKAESAELSATTTEIKATAERYYKIVAIIMLIQISCSALLWFFYSKIAMQDSPTDGYEENITDVLQRTDNLIEDGISNRFAKKIAMIETAFADLQPQTESVKTDFAEQKNSVTRETEINIAAKVEPPTAPRKPKTVRITGFQPQNQAVTDINAIKESVKDVNLSVNQPLMSVNSVNVPRETIENHPESTVNVSRETPENVEVKSTLTDNNGADTASVPADSPSDSLTEKKTPVKKCLLCGQELTASQIAHRAKFCSTLHRVQYFNANNGKQISVKKTDLR